MDGLPEICRRQPRCHCCALAETAPAALRRAHVRATEGWSIGSNVATLNDELTRSGYATLKDGRTLARHLGRHVDLDVLPRAAGVAAALMVVEGALEDNDEDDEDEDDDDAPVSLRLERLVSSMSAVFYGAVDRAGASPAAQVAVMLAALGDKVRVALESLGEARSSDDYLRQLLCSHTRTLAFGISTPLRDALGEMRNALEAGHPEVALARIDLFMGEEWGQMFEQVQREAYAKTASEYRLSIG